MGRFIEQAKPLAIKVVNEVMADPEDKKEDYDAKVARENAIKHHEEVKMNL